MRRLIPAMIFLSVFATCGLNKALEGLGNPITLVQFKAREVGMASLSNKDETLLCSISGQRMYWYKAGIKVKEMSGASGSFSPDGSFYSYVRNGVLFVHDYSDKLILQYKYGGSLESYEWSLDSRYIYLCKRVKENVPEYAIERLDVSLGKSAVILKSKRYFHPVPIKEPGVLHILENRIPDSQAPECDIVLYDLTSGLFRKATLPRDDILIFDSFTVSPDGRYALFTGGDGYLYVVNLLVNEVVDRIQTGNAYVDYFSWRIDSSYVIFNPNGQKIVKYVIPKANRE